MRDFKGKSPQHSKTYPSKRVFFKKNNRSRVCSKWTCRRNLGKQVPLKYNKLLNFYHELRWNLWSPNADCPKNTGWRKIKHQFIFQTKQEQRHSGRCRIQVSPKTKGSVVYWSLYSLAYPWLQELKGTTKKRLMQNRQIYAKSPPSICHVILGPCCPMQTSANVPESLTLNFNRGTTGRILGQELVPPMGMIEVGEERPGNAEASSTSNSPRWHEEFDDQENIRINIY